MNILFIGNTQSGPGGEPADETHLVRELKDYGNKVAFVPRDEWREYVEERFPKGKYKVPEPQEFHPDIAIICKWHHFYDARFINAIKERYNCPVVYWVWDFMGDESWHISMAKAANIYLSGELGQAGHYASLDIPFYYFQFDSTDKQFLTGWTEDRNKKYDVVFTGSCTNQNERLDILKEINKEIPIRVYGPDFEEWKKQGFDAYPPVYGQEFNNLITYSRIILGTSANKNLFGYWSNRIGKVLWARGFLLQWYTPGMESIIGDACEYFSSAEEAIRKIKFYLKNPVAREKFFEKILFSGPDRWTSEYKIRQLMILLDRYLYTKGKGWMLP